MKRLLLTATTSNHLQSNSLSCILFVVVVVVFFRVIFESMRKKNVCHSKQKKSQLKAHYMEHIITRNSKIKLLFVVGENAAREKFPYTHTHKSKQWA